MLPKTDSEINTHTLTLHLSHMAGAYILPNICKSTDYTPINHQNSKQFRLCFGFRLCSKDFWFMGYRRRCRPETSISLGRRLLFIFCCKFSFVECKRHAMITEHGIWFKGKLIKFAQPNQSWLQRLSQFEWNPKFICSTCTNKQNIRAFLGIVCIELLIWIGFNTSLHTLIGNCVITKTNYLIGLMQIISRFGWVRMLTRMNLLEKNVLIRVATFALNEIFNSIGNVQEERGIHHSAFIN